MIHLENPTQSVVTLPGLGSLRPGASLKVDGMTSALLRALDQGRLLAPNGAPAEPERGIPPVVFQHHPDPVFSDSLPQSMHTRVLRNPLSFHDGQRRRDYLALCFDGEVFQMAFSDDGLVWDRVQAVTGIADPTGPFAWCLEPLGGLRLYYHAAPGIRTAVSMPGRNPGQFSEDRACLGPGMGDNALVPVFAWSTDEAPNLPGRPFSGTYGLLVVVDGSLRAWGSDDTAHWRWDRAIRFVGDLETREQPAWPDVPGVHLQRLRDGRWWMVFPEEDQGRISLGYAYSYDRIHWRTAAFNPVFRAGEGAFSQHCYAPSVVPRGDGSFLVYRTGFDGHHHRTYVSLLRAEVLAWCDLMAPDRLGQGMMPRPLTRVGRGGSEDRDGLLPQPQLGDEWFNEQVGNGGRWEKFDGETWKRI